MNNLKKKTIGVGSSILLDSLRILAAVVVLIHHATQQWLTAYFNVVEQVENLAHAAVVIFFVLSGYLISYTTTGNNRGLRQYAAARLSRLYSIVLPAILLTAIIEFIVTKLNPSLALSYLRGDSLPRYALCLFFCNEIGSISAAPPINGPLWSLSYEFWYYVIFGFWFYRIFNWKSLLLFIGICFFAGTKILLLMPIWMFGFLAYRVPKSIQPTSKSWIFIFILFIFAGLAIIYLPAFPYHLGSKPFFFANQFVKDWIVGMLFSLALWHLPSEDYPLKSKLVGGLRAIADLSFPLYVLHYPLLVLWRAVFGWRTNDIIQMWQAVISVTLLSILIGFFLESYRHTWYRFFMWAINSIRLQPLFERIKGP
jgi:peptidoglycan/LPS O-acetylase OafA/YrhL